MFYFAYGSNMLTSRLTDRVGEVRLIGSALLQGYNLAFNKLGGDGTGKANIMQQDGGCIVGVVYKLTKYQMKKLDPFEGCFKKEKHYERKMVRVWLQGKLVLAWTYVATQKYISHGLEIATGYLDLISRGIVQHNLPIWYINQIKRIAKVEYLAYF